MKWNNYIFKLIWYIRLALTGAKGCLFLLNIWCKLAAAAPIFVSDQNQKWRLNIQINCIDSWWLCLKIAVNCCLLLESVSALAVTHHLHLYVLTGYSTGKSSHLLLTLNYKHKHVLSQINSRCTELSTQICSFKHNHINKIQVNSSFLADSDQEKQYIKNDVSLLMLYHAVLELYTI